MLTRGGYPFFRCKTKWEVTDAIVEREIKKDDSQEYGAVDSGGLPAETGLCDCEQRGQEKQEA